MPDEKLTVIVPQSVVAKPTTGTTAFHAMIAGWIAFLIVSLLAKYKVFVPEGAQGLIADQINASLPLLSLAIAGWLTKIVVQLSADKNAAKSDMTNQIVQAQVAPRASASDVNVNTTVNKEQA